MPNHIINTIRLTGDREKINELLESVKDNRFGIGSLDFNKVIPMPESLQIETSSSMERGLKAYKEFVDICTFDGANKDMDLLNIPEDKENIFFTGDLHFGHANVIAFDNRPFKTVEEMDAELIRRWNNKVGKGDLTYVLGDMIWKARNDDAPELIKSLNGQIILIKGNHDRFLHNAKAKAALAGIKDYDDICVSLEDGTKKRVILSHYFTPMYNGHRYQAIHLHAHSHFTDEADFEVDFAKRLNSIGCRNEIYNVGCMYWNYEPVTLDEIIENGRTIRPTYGERSTEYMAQFPWEKNQTVNHENEISWNVFYHNCNSRSIETFNVFEHGSFREYVKKAAKKYQNKEDFAKQLRSEVMYYFWSKCEWEVLVTPWISPRESEKKKIDVCWQIMNNWDVFVDYTWANRKKL